MHNRHSKGSPFISQSVSCFLKQRLHESFGLCLLLVGGFTGASLYSYDALDPSYNVAVDGHVQNIMGAKGAIVADILVQGSGAFAWLFALVPGMWGLFYLFQRKLRFLVARTVVVPFVILALAANCHYLSLPLQGGFLTHAALEQVTNSVRIQFPADYAKWIGFGSLLLLVVSLFTIAGVALRDLKRLLNALKKISNLPNRFQNPLQIRFSGPARSLLSSATRGHKLKEWKESLWPFESRKNQPDMPSFSEPHFENDAVCGYSSTPPQAGNEERYDIERNESNEFGKLGHEDGQTKPARFSSSEKKVKQKQGTAILELAHETYQLPPLELLNQAQVLRENASSEDDRQLQENARQLMTVLEEFGVKGQITKVRPGPVVTLYELVPAAGVKTSRVVGLADDIARSMCALSARIAVVPGQNALGIELPNRNRQMVVLRELMTNSYFDNASLKLALALGKDISGASVITDLARMPHLLVAGTTGSGKSVAINTMILSLLYRLSPDRCRFIMIDPKMLELSVYDGIPHLLAPVVTDPKKAIYALKWTVREMEDRYRAMSRLGVRNIEGYNIRLQEALQRGETLTRQVQTGFDSETGHPVFETQPLSMEPFPYIVVVVDEMADLMMVAGKEIEAAVQRLAQMARAAGIHLIMATQRPSVDVITGTIKANFPTRISFQVTSRFDSRTILGEQGAEQLLGRGDMLFMEPGGKIQRVHGPFVSDEEVEKIVRYLKTQGAPDYIENITEDAADTPLDTFGGGEDNKGDQLYQQAVALVQREGKASTSFVQRHLQIGYNRAARIIEQMENEGIISSANHVGKREVLNRAG